MYVDHDKQGSLDLAKSPLSTVAVACLRGWVGGWWDGGMDGWMEFLGDNERDVVFLKSLWGGVPVGLGCVEVGFVGMYVCIFVAE